jgi:hypothetical protein
MECLPVYAEDLAEREELLRRADGPVSMCEHNARRDDFILRPVALGARGGAVLDPTTGVTRLSTP